MVEQHMIAEADLILQAKNGDTHAYGVLYQRHFDAIYSYIYRRVTVVCEAEDLAQVVFLKAWQAIEKYQPSTTPFRGWLYRIAHNTVVDHYRTQKKNLQWEDLSTVADPATTPESALLEMERAETIRGALTTLHPSYREVITHRFIDEKDYAETAEALDRKVNNVRVLQHRALSALRRTLGQESALWIALAATAITLVFGTTIVQAATRALPDERLYPVRTLVEDARLALADDAADIRLHLEYADQRVIDLHTLTQEERVEAMDETVAQLSSHVTSASVKANELSRADDGGTAFTAQIDQTLLGQATSLADLESGAAPTTKEYIQSARDVVMDARHELHGENTPSTIKPSPEESTGSGSEPSTIMPEVYTSQSRPMTTTLSTTRMSPASSEHLETGDQPEGGPITTRSEPGTEAPLPGAQSAETAFDRFDPPLPSDAASASGPPHPVPGDTELPPAGTATLPVSMPQSDSDSTQAQNQTEPVEGSAYQPPASHKLPVADGGEQSPDSNAEAPVPRPRAESPIVDGEQPDSMIPPDTPLPDASRTELPPLEDEDHPAELPPIGEPEQDEDAPDRTPAGGPASNAPRAESPPGPSDDMLPSRSD